VNVSTLNKLTRIETGLREYGQFEKHTKQTLVDLLEWVIEIIEE
jgi:hypothetical protein